ncbi:helix-turn-helix transcriptional regulator [Aeromonas hydrophila]|uniref:helix-turn-helix transcriptional regulator n=1 Tax=Aeromonas hydrophila TaxID=644 RepID=UPI003EC77F33
MLIAISEVTRRLGVSRSTIERLRRKADENFPQPIRIGPNSIRFNTDELDTWLASRRLLQE